MHGFPFSSCKATFCFATSAFTVQSSRGKTPTVPKHDVISAKNHVSAYCCEPILLEFLLLMRVLTNPTLLSGCADAYSRFLGKKYNKKNRAPPEIMKLTKS